MCGIWGFFSGSGEPPTEEAARPLFTRLRHRGPDQMRFLRLEHAAFAHTRLSIIDLSDHNSQPLVTERCVVVFNGEIYNFRELRRSLSCNGTIFKSEGEAEVIAKGYEAWGSKIFEQIQGMYAIGLFDRMENTLMLCRDRFGIKPLYWRYDTDGLLFASEIKALSRELRFGLDREALADLMTFGYYFENRSVFSNVFSLAAGEVRKFSCIEGRIRSTSIVVARPAEIENHGSAKAVREAVTASVQAHLISDVPVATALSGGIDSSIITVVAAKSNPQITAITNTWLGLDDLEVRYAGWLTRKLGLDHIAYYSAIRDGLKLLTLIAWHLEDPIPNVASFHSYLIAEACHEAGLKVVLLGEGSDELFAGYPWHRLALAKGHRSQAVALFNAYEQRRSQRMTLEHFLTAEGRSLLAKRAAMQRELFIGFMKSFPGTQLDAFLAFERLGQLQVSQLQRVDRMYMAHGVEARVPYLYDNVVTLASHLPEAAKISSVWWRRIFGLREDKVMLAKAFSGIVPHFNLHRPKSGPKGTTNVSDHLAPTLAHTFDVVLKSNEFFSARSHIADIVNWRAINPSQTPFKVKLLLTLMTLCIHQFHLAFEPWSALAGPPPVRRTCLFRRRHIPASQELEEVPEI